MAQACIVGALACQRNSYLKSLRTKVVSCTKYQPAATSKASRSKERLIKETINGTAISDSSESWLIEFEDSVLFPEGGGQPSDFGSLSLLDTPEEKIPIKFVERQGLRCVCHSPKPLPVGSLAEQEIDFARRWDHMQQHTGQHLLSAIMDRYENLETLGWGMAPQGEMNYVELPRKPTPQEILEIQNKCNEAIRANHSITVETPESVDAPKLPGDYDKENGVVRIIRIGDVDANPCCGTHLSQTSHISLLLLHHTQPIRKVNTRLYFTAGDRAINIATHNIQTVRTIGQTLSTGSTPDEVIGNVKKYVNSASEARKREQKLLSELAKFEGNRIKDVLESGGNAWVYRADGGLDYINMVISEIKEAIKTRGMVVLASGEARTQGSVVAIGEKALVDDFIPKMKDIVEGIKGGGSGGKWQGKVTAWKKGELEALQKLVEE